MSGLAAVIMDTVSIQSYIFSSNKLKENIGASYLVKKIYEVELKEALEKVFHDSNVDIKAWESEPDRLSITNPLLPFEIGYIGGGNAVILFKDKAKAVEFVREFSKLLLKRTPGLKVAFGLTENFDLNDFKSSIKELHESLKKNKNRCFPNIILQKHGFTADCPRTGESAEIFKDENEGTFVSSVAYAKIEAAKDSKCEMRDTLKNVLKDKYTITNDVEKLGPKKEELNYIAVVHIDANKMGERFMNCKSLPEIRKLSKEVRNATEKAFEFMMSKTIKKIEGGILSEDKGFSFGSEDNKTILPIRPIIIGGDEITFVCDGRLALWLAEIFMKELIGQNVTGGKPLSACGGIAVVKTKYPFFRAYEMAECLTKKAKIISRDEENSSYIDFFISSGGWPGEEIEKNYYWVLEGNLHFGPYRVDGDRNINECHIDNLKEVVKGLKEFPMNKVMKLRDVLYEDKGSAMMFVKELETREHRLPEIPGKNYHRSIWVDSRTPYFDAIELMNFYPEGLL